MSKVPNMGEQSNGVGSGSNVSNNAAAGHTAKDVSTDDEVIKAFELSSSDRDNIFNKKPQIVDDETSNSGDLLDEAELTDGGLIRVKKKRRKKLPRVVFIILTALLVILGGIGVFVGWHYNTLSNSLAYTGNFDELKEVLVAPEEPGYQEPFYVLVIGSDKWQQYGGRSDLMMLLRIDINNAKITMVSVPRDTRYQVNGTLVKMNVAYADWGEVGCIEVVSELTGVPISHYVQVEFDQLESVVDTLGGILVDVPFAIDYDVYTGDQPTVHVDAGPQVLNGTQAVALSRERVSYVHDQDATRQANIRAMMTAMIKQVLASPPHQLLGNVQTLATMVSTDIPMNTILDWALRLSQGPNVTLYSCTGPYEGDIDPNSVGGNLWLTYEASESWAALMAAVDAGENPESVLTYTTDGGLKLQKTEVIDTGEPDGGGAENAPEIGNSQ